MRDVTKKQGVVEQIEFLARSPVRVQLLQTLSENERMEKHELKAAVDGSRTTVTRNIDALADQGWIRSNTPRYSITASGQQVADDFLDVVETMDVAVRLKDFFKWVPAAALDLDLTHLADAELVVAEPGDPWAMINRHVSKLKTMTECRSLLPITGLHASEAGTNQIINEEARGDLVVEPHVADTFQSNPQYAEIIDEAAATGRLEVFVYDGTIPYGMSVIDETVQLIVADSDEPRALLESDASEVHKWAVRTFDEYKRQATPVF